MDRSESIDALAAALTAAQGEFEAVAKGAENPFFKSKYADLPSVVRAATPVLAKNQLAVTQLLGLEDGTDTLTTVLTHSSGQFIAGTQRLLLVKADPQGQGSAITYARRYGYMAVLGLVADEDDDGNAAAKASSKQSDDVRGRLVKYAELLVAAARKIDENALPDADTQIPGAKKGGEAALRSLCKVYAEELRNIGGDVQAVAAELEAAK
jgi:hypothetical protein